MRSELWMQKIKERLKDYSEQLPESGWEQLENDLHTSIAPPDNQKKKIIPLFNKYAAAAAAVLLFLLSTTGIWLFHTPIEEKSLKPAANTATLPDRTPQTLQQKTDIISPINHLQAYAKSANRQGTIQQVTIIQQEEHVDAATEEETPTTPHTSNQHQKASDQETQGNSAHNRTSAKQARSYPRTSKKEVQKKTPKGWSIGFSVGNAGGSSNLANRTGYSLKQNSTSLSYSEVDFFAAPDKYASNFESHELVFKRGIPYLMERSSQISSISHKLPISAGISVRKQLPKGFSIETGLTYTYLASDITFGNSPQIVNQKLHYLGIPLRANWNFLNRRDFTLYVSAGGAIEKCIYGEVGNQAETVKPLQYSVSAAVGAQYNLSRRVGIYAEPGIAYFFDDGSRIETIRKENPCNFTLQAGLRLTY